MNCNFTPTAKARFGLTLYLLLLFSDLQNLAAQSPYCAPLYNNPCTATGGLGVHISQFNLSKNGVSLIADAVGCTTTPSSGLHLNYSNLTSTSPSVVKGISYDFTIAFALNTGATTNAGFAIWVDWNNNNDFTDVGELIASSTTVTTSNFQIPTTATSGNHRMRVRSLKTITAGVPTATIPTNPCATYDVGDVHDYTINVIECPTLTKTINKRINIPCVGGHALGELNVKSGGGTAPYTYNMSGQTNTNGVFTNLKPSDYALIITDNNGCSTAFVETLESTTNFSKLNDAMTTQDWVADSISQTMIYLTGANAVLTPLNDSLAKYNRGASDSISKYIPLGFSFQFDNFYYDSLVVSENGAVSFNPHINPLTVSSQWFDNAFYKGRGNGGGGNSSDCDTAFLDNPLPFIAAFRDDLQANNSGNVASQINYKLSGIAPNRVFTVEWRNMQWHKVCNSPRNNAISLQLMLYEGSNKVEMNYKAEPNLAANCDRTEPGYGYTVGLFGRRLGSGNYIAYNPEEGTATRFENTYDPTNPSLHPGVTTNNAYFPDGKLLKFTPPQTDASCTPLSITSVKATCSSGADGTITIVAAGGILSSGTYYFSKDGGINYYLGSGNASLFIGSGNTGTFYGLAPGTYTVAVHDNPLGGNGSPNNWSFVTQTIVVPNASVSGTIQQQLTCNGDVSGAIQFNWAKSSATYDLKFQKTGGTLFTFNGLTDTFKLFTGLSAGIYNVTVTFNDFTCSSTAKVTLADPPVSCKPATIQLNALGNATLTLAEIDNNPTDNCGFTQRSLSKTSFDCSNLGSNTVIFSATDASGNTATCSAIVTIEDKTPPSVFCKPATLQLDAMGNATLTVAQIDNNSTDNCSITQRSLSKTAFNCSNLGSNTVIFTATDAAGNTATCSAIVTIEDKTAPSVFCKPATLQLDAMGNVTLTVAQIDNNSTDNCSITQRSLSKTAFNCSNLGSNTVIFTTTDDSGNTATCSAIVTIEDKTAPSVFCKPATIQLDALGNATLTIAQIDNNSTDNCSITQRSLSKTAFNCSNLGSNTVIFTATDAAGNTATCSAIVTIEDKIAPSVFCKPATIQLDALGNTTLTIAQIDNNSTDNCSITQRSLSKTAFNCSNLGSNIVIFTATDAAGNTATCSAIVTIEDKIAPSVFCKPATIQLDALGNTTLTIAQIDNNSTDNCSITQRSLSKTAFNCSNLGSNIVIFTATDAAGNTATCSAIVTIEDKIPPSVFCKAATLQLNAMGNATLNIAQIDNNTTDNCSITQRSLSKTAFNCSNLGSNTVIFTATDAAGNTATCSAIVTIEDKIAPIITCPNNISVTLGSGECQKVLNFAATATDNCTTSPTIKQLVGLQSGEMFGIGRFNTGFESTDASGNTSTCLFSITVTDNPSNGMMNCASQLNVTINENCQTRILPEFFLLGNNYSCFENYSVQIQTLGGTNLPNDYITSSQIGTTLRAIVTEKASGNSCTGTFKVFDLTPPTIQAPDAIAVTCDNVPFNGIPDTSITGVPKVLKECSLVTFMHFSDNIFDIDCGVNITTPPMGFPTDLPFNLFLAQNTKRIIVRTFTVYDRYNNTSTTRQTIYIVKSQISDVTFTSSINSACGNRRIEPTDTIIDGITIRGMGYPSLPGKYSLIEGFCPIRADYSDVRTRDSLNNSFIIKRSWSLVNTCTNESRTWVQTIVYHDAPPELGLLQNAVFHIQTNGLLTIKASDLIGSLTDDCTPNNKIVYGLRIVGRAGTGFPIQTSYTFDCNQKGTYNIEIWVKDDIGNIVMKTTSFTVNDDLGNCPKIGGIIQREDLIDVPANIVLYNEANELIDSTTGSSYFFKDLSANNRYRIVPSRPNTDWLNGVTMFDVALMSRHLLGVDTFSTPYRLISADVNRNGEIDAVDMLLMQRLILRITATFPSNNSWRFVVKNYAFIDPTNPFASDFPESLIIPSLSNSVSNGDFVAIKTGDVNLSAGSVDIRSGVKPFILSVDDIVLEKNKTYEIPIKITPYQRDYNGRSISALQFSLNIDKNTAQIENTTKGDLPNCTENNVAIFKNEGIVTAAWYRSPNQKFIETDTFTMLNLTITPTKNTRLSQILSINPTFTEGVAYDEIGNGAAVKLSFGNTYKQTSKPTLLPSRPNPFSDETTISFLLPETGFAKLTVCDLLGRVLMTTEKAFSQGLNEVVFSSKNTPSVSSGILVVRLQTANGLAEQKIVFSR